MPSSSKNDIILVRYPFSDLSGAKVRPAVVVSAPHSSQDIFIVPLTSKTAPLLAGEFLLADWKAGGLNFVHFFSGWDFFYSLVRLIDTDAPTCKLTQTVRILCRQIHTFTIRLISP